MSSWEISECKEVSKKKKNLYKSSNFSFVAPTNGIHDFPELFFPYFDLGKTVVSGNFPKREILMGHLWIALDFLNARFRGQVDFFGLPKDALDNLLQILVPFHHFLVMALALGLSLVSHDWGKHLEHFVFPSVFLRFEIVDILLQEANITKIVLEGPLSVWPQVHFFSASYWYFSSIDHWFFQWEGIGWALWVWH